MRMDRRLFLLTAAAAARAGAWVRAASIVEAAQGGRAANSGTTLRVGFARGSTYDISSQPLDIYVARVLAGEAARNSRPAALEALAIAVRTYAMANLGRHRSDGFDLCDQTHCQVVRTATPVTERASSATAGQVLLDRGAPASVFYSASCGGRTERPSEVWPGAEDPPFLPSRPDDACRGQPVWTSAVDEADLRRALEAAGFRGRLRNLRVASRNGSGRVAKLALDGVEPSEISGQDLRVAVGRTLGWQHIRSTAFELRRAGNAYRFDGHGSGHGVGMCVIGSWQMADQGRSATEILDRYFPGLAISATISATPIPETSSIGTDVLVSLPEGDEGERRAIAAMTSRARDELTKTLGVPSSGVSLRFHPTTAAFERATGQPWFTSVAVVNSEAQLLPPAVLRDRGVLERTVRRALVHVLADSTLRARPMWVREGAAAYFADPGGVVPERIRPLPGSPQAPRGSCPDDNELLHPVSIGALSNAYERARICFAQQIAQGRSWRDVR
jgi:SpoIID/LytB domain protein